MIHTSAIADIDECLMDPCDENAYCENFNGGYYCNCEEGFTGNGTVCTCECFGFQFPLISVVTLVCLYV